MFGSSKKKKETFIHPLMGELQFQGVWLGRIECMIYNFSSIITLIIYVDEDFKDDFTVQERSYIYYRDNMDKINAEVRAVLLETYDIEELSVLQDRFEPTSFIINQNGDCAFSFRDKEEPRGFSSAQIVVTVTPNVEYFGSEDDYI